MKNKIIGYGELLLRLTPSVHGNLLEQSDTVKMAYAGAEANIIADLALLGHNTAFVSAFPKNPLGRSANQFLQSFGVDTNPIIWDKGRMGTYYIEHGKSVRGSSVTYDRAASSVTNAKISHEQWKEIFSEASFFILTGITPALSQICRDNIKNALEVAKELGVKIVFDLNYRRTLWPIEEARSSFKTILPFVDILIANVGSAYDVFNITTSPVTDNETLKEATKQATDALASLGNFEYVGMTMRLQTNASENQLSGLIKKGDQYYYGNSIKTEIVDRLGGGDAFAAAAIHGITKDWDLDKTVNFATAAFAVTQTLDGDINYATEEDLLEIGAGNTMGYVKR